MNRIDLHIEVNPVPFEDLSSMNAGESSTAIRERVIAARSAQLSRFEETPGIYTKAMTSPNMVRKVCVVDQPAMMLLKIAMKCKALLLTFKQ